VDVLTIPRRAATPLIVIAAALAGTLGIVAAASMGPGSDRPTSPSTPSSARSVPTAPPSPIVGPADRIPPVGPIAAGWCSQDQLELTGVDGDAATGHRAAGYRARNIGQRACVLDGYPDVAIASPLGEEIEVTIVHGGGFMTVDPGPSAVTLQPGATAMSLLAWDASDGRTRIGAVYLAAYPGLVRTVIPASWDMTSATTVAVTAWGPDLGALQE
jgi:hypothetical protein